MTKICTIHVDDEVNARIGGLHPENLEILWDKFGIFVDGYYHMPAFQLRRWDGKIRFFEKTGKTYTKLLSNIHPYLKAWGYEVRWEDHRAPKKTVLDRIDENFFGKDDYTIRPYQVEVVNALLNEGSGIAVCATGAGKTSMCAALSLILLLNGLQTIIIVPSSDLVTQTINEIRDKLSVFVTAEVVTIGEYSGDTKNIDCHIVVATWQALQNAPHLMGFFQAVICDECHGAKAEVIGKLLNHHGRNITHRFGVTGTMPKPPADQMTLTTIFGPIVREITARWLIDNGYLSEVEIEPVETLGDDPELPDYASEKSYLSKHEGRLGAIARDIMDSRDRHGNTFVLVNSIAQGHALQDLIPDSVFLYGDTKKAVRQEHYAEYANKDGIIVIANAQIAATGLSIDRIFCMYMIDAGKSFVKAIQSVGRGLRKKGDKNMVYIKDVYSKFKFSKKHWKDRQRYYREAQYPMAPVRKMKYDD